MNRNMCRAGWLVWCVLALAGSLWAQDDGPAGAKDLYLQYGNGSQYGNSSPQRSGPGLAQVSILLRRGNMERLVAPSETFYSGDQIRLVVEANFDGYVAVVNQGPSGRARLLFPYPDAAGRYVNNRVMSHTRMTIPRGNDWIVFDDLDGWERVSVIFSGVGLSKVDDYTADYLAAGEQAGTAGLRQLLADAQGRAKDLVIRTNAEGVTCALRRQTLSEPVAFTFTLNHRSGSFSGAPRRLAGRSEDYAEGRGVVGGYGRPGVKVTLELLRDGKLKFVAPDYKFKSGDQIRLRLATNFDGYVAVYNIGTSGLLRQLYPYGGDAGRIRPTEDYTVPQVDDWIVFDEQKGTETVTVIMSQQPLAEMFGPSADIYHLAKLTNRTERGKDLFIGTEQESVYAVCEEGRLAAPVAFNLFLKHR